MSDGFTIFGAVASKLSGVAILIGLAWLLSEKRKLFPWRTVLCGLGLQFGFAILILKTKFGAGLFEFLQHVFNKLSDFAAQGAKMVFGPLADSGIMTDKFGGAHAFLFAISITSSIIVVSSISSFLLKGNPTALSPRTVTLATYALCGFANFSSIAIQIGGISAIEPRRRADLARYGVRSMIGGLLTCYLCAAIAGLLIE